MLKNLLAAVILCMSIQSCSKDENAPAADTNNGNNNNTSVPTSFTQKVLIESFTGAGQSQCTDGFVKLNAILTSNPTKAIPVQVHYGDAMEIPQYTALFNTFSNGSAAQFPSGMINRSPSLSMVIFNRTQWQSNFDVAKVKTAKTGISINSSISGTSATIAVKAGFCAAMSGAYSITTYLVENNVVGSGSLYDQRNAYNTITGHTYAGAGDPILNFSHQNVLRKVVSSAMGDPISSNVLVAGGHTEYTYTTSLAGLNQNELYIVSFVSKVGTGATDCEVMNVQKVKVGQSQGWD